LPSAPYGAGAGQCRITGASGKSLQLVREGALPERPRRSRPGALCA
jgi:hypothetical protein